MPQKPGIKLSQKQRKVLADFMDTAKDKREYRAALGIILRGEGKSAEYVAQKLKVTMKQVFTWCRKFRESGINLLRVKKQTGRPPFQGKKAKKIIPQLLKKSPEAFGFLKGRWVLRDISKALKKEGIEIHYSGVHRVLRDLGINRKSPILRAPGSLKKNYRKREEIRRYKKVAAAILKKESLLLSKMKSG